MYQARRVPSSQSPLSTVYLPLGCASALHPENAAKAARECAASDVAVRQWAFVLPYSMARMLAMMASDPRARTANDVATRWLWANCRTEWCHIRQLGQGLVCMDDAGCARRFTVLFGAVPTPGRVAFEKER